MMKRIRKDIVEVFQYNNKYYERVTKYDDGTTEWYEVHPLSDSKDEVSKELYSELETQYKINFGIC